MTVQKLWWLSIINWSIRHHTIQMINKRRTIMAKGMKEKFHQENYHKKIIIDRNKSIKSSDHFGFVPVRGSVLTSHQFVVWKSYSILPHSPYAMAWFQVFCRKTLDEHIDNCSCFGLLIWPELRTRFSSTVATILLPYIWHFGVASNDFISFFLAHIWFLFLYPQCNESPCCLFSVGKLKCSESIRNKQVLKVKIRRTEWKK